MCDNVQGRIVVYTVQLGLKYEEHFERKTDVYVKLMVIIFVSCDRGVLGVLVIDRGYWGYW